MKKTFLPLVAALAWAGAAFIAAAAEISMPVLFVTEQEGAQTSGGFCRLVLTCERSAQNRGMPIRIAVSDDTPAGGGESLRGCLWIASVAAGLARNDVLDGVRLHLEMKGQIDGPSVGAISCLSILSWLDGRTLPTDFAMTGTILPDGTVGTVGGIAYKLEAAASNGVTRACIPAFERFEKQDDGKSFVDLYRLGEKLGIQVFPVQTIEEAYAIAHRLPASRAAVTTDLEELPPLPQKLENGLVRLYQDLAARLTTLKENILGTSRSEDIADLEVAQTLWLQFAAGKVPDPKDGVEDVPDPLKALVQIAGAEVMRSWLEDDTHVRDFRAGRFLAAVRNVMTRVALWQTMATWTDERQMFFKRHPLLARNPPFTKNVRQLVRDEVEGLLTDYRRNVQNRPSMLVAETGLEPVSKDLPLSAAQFETFRTPAELLLPLSTTKLGRLSEHALDTADDDTLKGIVLFDGLRQFFKTYDRIWAKEEQVVRRHLAELVPAVVLSEKIASVERFFFVALSSVVAQLDAYANEDAANPPVKKRGPVLGEDLEEPVMVISLPDQTFQEAFARLLDEQMLLEKPDKLANRGYHETAALFLSADLLARACAQFVLYDSASEDDPNAFQSGNALFLRKLLTRARRRALDELHLCEKMGLPVVAARLAFETAELSDRNPERDLVREVLANYWAAEFSARAFRLAFTPPWLLTESEGICHKN